MNSFCMGAIFFGSLGHKLSRNGVVVSVYALEQNIWWRKDFLVTPKSRDFHDFSSFLEGRRTSCRELLECRESVLECLRRV